jgi:hypothetical protein
LELKNVVGFIDNTHAENAIKVLRLDEAGDSNNLDLMILVFPHSVKFRAKKKLNVAKPTLAQRREYERYLDEQRSITSYNETSK